MHNIKALNSVKRGHNFTRSSVIRRKRKQDPRNRKDMITLYSTSKYVDYYDCLIRLNISVPVFQYCEREKKNIIDRVLL